MPLSNEELRKTCALYNVLGTAQAAAKALDLTKAAVLSRIKKSKELWGDDCVTPLPRIPDDQLKKVVNLYERLGSVTAVSRKTGHSPMTVSRRLRMAELRLGQPPGAEPSVGGNGSATLLFLKQSNFSENSNLMPR